VELGITIAGVVAIIVLVLLFLYLSVRVVQQYEKMVVFRLGRTNEGLVRDPGLRFLIPIIDRPVKVDVREQFIEVPSQTTITRDNAPINVDFLIYWRIVDPLKSIVNVAYFAGALQGVATTTLRAVIGDILLDEVLSRREQINEVLRTKLDEVTERWGGKVTTVEIREITPPRDVQDAMNRQLSAERTRRAVITESEGRRQSEINIAEGAKQAAILTAEGERQAQILRAEGTRQSQILNAEGFGQALTRIYESALRSTRRRCSSSTSRHSSASARARPPSTSSRPSSPSSSGRWRRASAWRSPPPPRRPRRAEASRALRRGWYHRTGVGWDLRPLSFGGSGGAARSPAEQERSGWPPRSSSSTTTPTSSAC
jgi:regulator of protease activity HflC (stomatin/prohibitin superfamily)